MDEHVSGLQRFFLAFVAFFAVWFNRDFADGVFQLRERQKAGLPPGPTPPKQIPEQAPQQKPAAPPAPKVAQPDALHMLAILQRDGRLIDFLQEDLSGFGDAEIGAAARTVHEGCRKVLQSYFTLEHVYTQPEGAGITVESGFDPARVRLTGNVVGSPPFKGTLRHAGWRAAEVKLPARPEAQDATIIAPAEVEL